MANTETTEKFGVIEGLGATAAISSLVASASKISTVWPKDSESRKSTLGVLEVSLKGTLATTDWDQVPPDVKSEVDDHLRHTLKVAKVLADRISHGKFGQMLHVVKHGRFATVTDELRTRITDMAKALEPYRRRDHQRSSQWACQAGPAMPQQQHNLASTPAPVQMHVTLINCTVVVDGSNGQAHGNNHGQFPRLIVGQGAYENPPLGYPLVHKYIPGAM